MQFDNLKNLIKRPSEAKVKEPEKLIKRRNGDTGTENQLMDTRGERGGGMNWEIGIDTLPLILAYLQMGRNPREEKIDVHVWLIHFAEQQKRTTL